MADLRGFVGYGLLYRVYSDGFSLISGICRPRFLVPGPRHQERSGQPVETVVLHPSEVTVQTLTGYNVKVDAFEDLLVLAGLVSLPAREETLALPTAIRLLALALQLDFTSGTNGLAQRKVSI